MLLVRSLLAHMLVWAGKDHAFMVHFIDDQDRLSFRQKIAHVRVTGVKRVATEATVFVHPQRGPLILSKSLGIQR